VAADVASGRGLVAAVAGVDAVVHLASATRLGQSRKRVDVGGTRRVVEAAAGAGVRHLVYVSIVGVDRVPLGYYRCKLAAEHVVAAGGVPYTIVRATQFFDLIEAMMRGSQKLGLLISDRRVVAQPVDAGDVAGRIVERLGDGPLDGIEEYGGPQVMGMADAGRLWLAARGRRARILPVRFPGRIGRAMRAGGLTTAATPTGEVTWAEFLRRGR
jgi:uncharacterized protein YbjT (DUF2867 family)